MRVGSGPPPSGTGDDRPRRASRTGPEFPAEIYRLQLELFQANQALINEAVERTSTELKRYEARYKRAIKTAGRAVSWAEVLRATRRSRIILVGDYHTLPQAQRAFLRILKAQPPNDRVVVALEMLRGRDQPVIERYVQGDLSERSFLKATQHYRHWPFGPFETARPLFELAQKRGWRVIGIDRQEAGSSSLAERDRYAAARIAEALAADPGARVFALIGEMHLAPTHLPLAIRRALGRSDGTADSIVRLHQNPDQIWFDLASHGLTDVDVVEVDDDAFALLSASPVVCQQSFLTWLEQAEDGSPEAPIITSESGERSVRQATRIIGRALRLPVRRALRGLEVVGPADLSFFEGLRASGRFSRSEMKQIRAQILASESYYIPKANMIYLATLSLSHAAEEAAHMLRHHLSHEGLDDPKALVDAFYARVMNEAIGFLGSKIVNPHRRCVHVPELEEMASGRSADFDPFEVAAATFAVEHKRMESGVRVPKLSRVFHASPELFLAVTHILGYILGDQIYAALARGKLDAREVRSLFYEPFEDEGAALLIYFELITRVGGLRPPRATLPPGP